MEAQGSLWATVWSGTVVSFDDPKNKTKKKKKNLAGI